MVKSLLQIRLVLREWTEGEYSEGTQYFALDYVRCVLRSVLRFSNLTGPMEKSPKSYLHFLPKFESVIMIQTTVQFIAAFFQSACLIVCSLFHSPRIKPHHSKANRPHPPTYTQQLYYLSF